jgi:hypothetical protein
VWSSDTVKNAILAMFLVGALVACGRQLPPPSLTLEGEVANWSGGATSVTAPLWPSGDIVARGDLAADGHFSVVVPGAMQRALLAGGFVTAVEGYTCSAAAQDPGDAKLVALYYLGLDDSSDSIVLASSQDFADGSYAEGEWGYQWFYADQPVTVIANCGTTFDGRTFAFDYDLVLGAGWNPVRLTTTTATAAEVTFDV